MIHHSNLPAHDNEVLYVTFGDALSIHLKQLYNLEDRQSNFTFMSNFRLIKTKLRSFFVFVNH